jgi:hypothetical protein
LDLDVSLERGQHDDPGVGELRENRDQRVDSADVRHAEIHQRHVGPVLAEELNRFTAARCLRDHRHVGLAADHGRDPFAQKRMIVNAEHANRILVAHVSAASEGGASRNAQFDLGARRRTAADREASADSRGALLHAGDAPVAGDPRARDLRIDAPRPIDPCSR